MRAGRAYTASNLARLHGASLDASNSALRELVAEGKLRPCYNARREQAFCSTREEPSPAPDDADGSTQLLTTVATFPVTRRVEGSLTDYGRLIDAHRALAMLARR